jgi:hypothetical protein
MSKFRLKLWMAMLLPVLAAMAIFARVNYLGFVEEVAQHPKNIVFGFRIRDETTKMPIKNANYKYRAHNGWHKSSGGLANGRILELDESSEVYVSSNGYKKRFVLYIDGADKIGLGNYDMEFSAEGYRRLKTTLRELVGERVVYDDRKYFPAKESRYFDPEADVLVKECEVYLTPNP